MKNTILFSLAFVVGVALLLGGCASRKETTRDVHERGIYSIEQVIRYYQ